MFAKPADFVAKPGGLLELLGGDGFFEFAPQQTDFAFRTGLGRLLLAFTRQQLPDEIELRCIRENEKAWRWYEREGFVFEKEAVEPMTGFVMKYYRWNKRDTAR